MKRGVRFLERITQAATSYKIWLREVRLWASRQLPFMALGFRQGSDGREAFWVNGSREECRFSRYGNAGV